MTATELKNHPVVQHLRQIQTELSLGDSKFKELIRFKIHAANWGKIIAGTYQGNFTNALVDFEVCLDAYENQGLGELEEGIVVLDHVRQTLDAVDIANAAEDEHRLVILCGVRGAGKTRTQQLVHAKHPGYITSARPSWSKSYLNFLNQLAATPGINLSESRSAGEAEGRLLKYMQETPRKTLCLGEFNYFSSDALGFVKTALNETQWTICADTIPFHLNRMASDRSTAQESAQLLRRATIIRIGTVTIRDVESIRKALFPHLDLTGHVTEIATTANQLSRIDTVCEILGDCNPGDPKDVPKAIGRYKCFKAANIKTEE